MLDRGMVGAALIAATSVAGSPAQKPAPRVIAMQDLTVPQDRLVPGCRLAPSPPVGGGDGARTGVWAGLPIPTNPWIGTDQALVAMIRGRMDRARQQAGGPSADPRPEARSSEPAAEAQEAYAAVYVQAGSESTAVYATRTAGAVSTPPDLETAPKVQPVPRIQIGPISIVISGERDDCSYAIESYLRSLSR